MASAALVAAALPLGAAPAGAQISTRPAVTLAGSVGTLPAASAAVVVDVNVPVDLNSAGDPQQIDEVPVASATITSPKFSIPVPSSSALQQAEQQGHGTVNFTVMAISGSDLTAEGIPAPIDISPAAANAAQLATQAAGTVQMPAFAAFHPMTAAQVAAVKATNSAASDSAATPDIIPPCTWKAYGSEYNDLTRIGEVHVANTSGLSDTFWFRHQNDETITFGYSASDPTGNWTEGGTISLTDSLSSNGYHTFGQGAVDYADSTYYYQRYHDYIGECPASYEILAVGTSTVVGPGTNTPPVNPYGGCENDPYGEAFSGNSGWDYDVGKAETYSGIATVFGFTFGGSDGFTTDVEHDYTAANGAATTWLCGSPGDQITDSPILYNTTG